MYRIFVLLFIFLFSLSLALNGAKLYVTTEATTMKEYPEYGCWDRFACERDYTHIPEYI